MDPELDVPSPWQTHHPKVGGRKCWQYFPTTASEDKRLLPLGRDHGRVNLHPQILPHSNTRFFTSNKLISIELEAFGAARDSYNQHLYQRGTDNLGLDNGWDLRDFAYRGTIKVGTPPVEAAVLFDTGTALTSILLSPIPNSASRNFTTSVYYNQTDGGSVSGYYGTENITVGGNLCARCGYVLA
jgi:hypothetical protein